MGTQGLCKASRDMKRFNVLVAHTVVTVSSSSTVPVQLMNPTDKAVVIDKNCVLATFQTLNPSYNISSSDNASNLCCHTHEQSSSVSDRTKLSPTQLRDKNHPSEQCHVSDPDVMSFKANFNFADTEMDPTQEQRLAEHLHVNRDIFVTADNPSLGATHLAEHQIHLKPNAVLKHQRPYRLTPDKREILRHHP